MLRPLKYLISSVGITSGIIASVVGLSILISNIDVFNLKYILIGIVIEFTGLCVVALSLWYSSNLLDNNIETKENKIIGNYKTLPSYPVQKASCEVEND